MRNAMLMLILSSLSCCGCAELLLPNGGSQGKPITPPVPSPTVSPQRLEIILKVDGEGRINVAGDGSINVKTSSQPEGSDSGRCECGCGKPGCVCRSSSLSQDLSARKAAGSPADAQAGLDAVIQPERREVLRADRDLFVLSPGGRCDACDLALADLTRLGFSVRKVIGETPPGGRFPAIRNRRGQLYELDDDWWNTGIDDVWAARKLSE